MCNIKARLTQLRIERGFFGYVMDSTVTDDETAQQIVKNMAKIGLTEVNLTEVSSNSIGNTDREIQNVLKARQDLLDACVSGVVGVTVSIGSERGVINYCGSELARPSKENPSVPLSGTFSLLPK